MKKKFLYLLLICCTILSFSISCQREQLPSVTQDNPPPPPPSPAVGVSANVNITLEGPINFAVLSGHVYGMGSNKLTYLWKKISGPASYTIEKADSLQTKVLHLERGTYMFELKATNTVGNYYADTMTLKVEDPTSSSRQIIFSYFKWECPLGCSINLENVLTYYVPVNSPFSMYIRGGFSSTWELVVPGTKFPDGKYYYSIWPDYIEVWPYRGFVLVDNPDIKISF